METEVNVGSIIQIRPDAKLDNCWQNLLLVVEEVKAFGVLAFALSAQTGKKDKYPGRFYIVLNKDMYDVVGAVQYLPVDLWDKLPTLEAVLFTPVNIEGA